MTDTPRNAFNSVEYKGYNTLFLEMEKASKGYTTNEWATFLDWKKHGFKVKKGMHGVHCRTFIKGDKIVGDKKKQLSGVAIKYFVLFNRDQVQKVNTDCPRCHSEIGEYPALSRKDNRTEICSQCSTLEALEDWSTREKVTV